MLLLIHIEEVPIKNIYVYYLAILIFEIKFIMLTNNL